MASVLTNPQVSAAIAATLSGGAVPATTSAAIAEALAMTYTVGTAAGNVNLVYANALTITSGAPQDFDVTALTDPLGAAINFGHVTDILLVNLSTTAGQDFTLGGAASNPLFAALPTVARANGGYLLIHDPNPGIAVSGGAKVIRAAVAAGAAVSALLLLLGRTT
jgi:hypothetical protein